MKELKELKFEELTTRQKLGMTFAPLVNGGTAEEREYDFILGLIKKRSLGAVWIQLGYPGAEETMKMIKEAADYPILIFTDAESGIKPYSVGRHNAIGSTGSVEHAYAFGKAVGVTAREKGYNVVCNPVVDMIEGSQRSLGTDKYKVTELASAMARGMHDGGVLTVGKHYPGGGNPKGIDSHMATSYSDCTKEELLDYHLYPYLKLNEQGLLDGIMTGHKKMVNIDPVNPASVSKKVIDIIREQGFDGFAITDGMCMMGLRSCYDDVTAKGLAIAAGNEFILPFELKNSLLFDQLCEAYDKGLIPDNRLDEAVKRILQAQHKAMILPKDSVLTEKEKELVKNINRDGVYTVKTDEGITDNISRDGKHLFVIMVGTEIGIDGDGRAMVDTFSGGWHFPDKISAKIKELFPNSDTMLINQFPTPNQNSTVLDLGNKHDDVIYITFSQSQAYVGREHLTRRLMAAIEALQYTNKVSTVVHFGNPYVLEELPHIPRYIIGGASEASVNACLEILAGEYPAKGIPTWNAKLK